MRSSSSQYCRKSLPLTSALLPSEIKLEMPMPARVAAFSTAMPTAPDCEASAIGPGMAFAAPNVASRRTDGSVLTMPTQFGPMILMPCLRAALVNSRWRSAPSAPTSAKPPLITTSPRAPFAAQSGTSAATLSAAMATMPRSIDTRNLGDRSERGQTFDGVALRVHRIDRATESCLEQAVDDFVADGAGAPAGTDHGDRSWPHQVLDRSRLGDVFAAGDPVDEIVGDVESHHQMLDAAVPCAHGRQTRVAEDPLHPAVLGERVGHEGGQAFGSGAGGEVLEQERGDAAALPCVCDDEGDLCLL